MKDLVTRPMRGRCLLRDVQSDVPCPSRSIPVIANLHTFDGRPTSPRAHLFRIGAHCPSFLCLVLLLGFISNDIRAESINLPNHASLSDPEPFLAYVDPQTSQGAIALRGVPGTHETNVPTLVKVFSWKNGDYVSEWGFPSETSALHLTNVVLASGRYNGTNWNYSSYASNVTIVKWVDRNADLYNLIKDLGGKWPEEAEFESILGRGFYIDDFKHLRINGNVLTGVYHRRLAIEGRISCPTNLQYDYYYRILGTETVRRHSVMLQPFANGSYVPLHIRTWYAINGTNEQLESAYDIIALTNSPAVRSFSPLELYPWADLIFREGDRLFEVRNGDKYEIQTPRSGIARTWRRVFLILSGALTFSICLIYIFWKLRYANTRT